jgi:molybdate transport system substrate-binding protein
MKGHETLNVPWIKFAVAAGAVASALVCEMGCQRRADSVSMADARALPSDQRSTDRPLIVSAAASTKEVMEELAQQFQAANGVKVVLNFGGSNTLATQIINGAPADLLLSASMEWITAVAEAGMIQRQIVLLENALVIIVPPGNPAGVRQPSDLLGESVQHLALAGETVPAGRYADQALRATGQLERLAVAGKIARGQDVRVALSYVERGEAEAGIVYATDAQSSMNVELVYTFDAVVHEPIQYGLAHIAQQPPHPAADAFFDFLASDAAAEAFRRRGFRRATPHDPLSEAPSDKAQQAGRP